MNPSNLVLSLAVVVLFNVTARPATAQTVASDTIPYAAEHHQARLALFAKEPVAKHRVIFIGNSITEFGDWAPLLGDSTVVNRGIAGDITFGILRRLDDVVRREPAKLFIEAGINDIAKNVATATIAKQISAIVATVRRGSPGTKIYVTSVLPTNDAVKKEYPDAYRKNDRVEAVNKLLRANASRDGYTYVDLHRVLSEANGQLNPKYADADGLHLNPAGYQAWVGLLRRSGFLPGRTEPGRDR